MKLRHLKHYHLNNLRRWHWAWTITQLPIQTEVAPEYLLQLLGEAPEYLLQLLGEAPDDLNQVMGLPDRLLHGQVGTLHGFTIHYGDSNEDATPPRD